MGAGKREEIREILKMIGTKISGRRGMRNRVAMRGETIGTGVINKIKIASTLGMVMKSIRRMKKNTGMREAIKNIPEKTDMNRKAGIKGTTGIGIVTKETTEIKIVGTEEI